jgi:hypothetical protein
MAPNSRLLAKAFIGQPLDGSLSASPKNLTAPFDRRTQSGVRLQKVA